MRHTNNKKIKLVLLFSSIVFITNMFGQKGTLISAEGGSFGGNNQVSTQQREVKVELDGKTHYTDYKVITINNDTAVIDTTLTLKKDAIFNYLRKDNFELLPFHNQGQTFNKLGYNFQNSSIFPSIGFGAKQFNYFRVEDVKYYRVPTPTSEVMYRTGLEQGQVLDAFITMNTSEQLNFALAYKGLRSLGKYRNALASHGNFRASFNYVTKSKKYAVKGHFYSYDLLNNENGGLTEVSLANFESGNTNYTDRGRLDVNYTNADNILEGKRYFLDHSLTIFSKKNKIDAYNIEVKKRMNLYGNYMRQISKMKKDTANLEINTPKIDSLSAIALQYKTDSTQFKTYQKNRLYSFNLGHTFEYETQHYRFNQTAVNSIFGDAFTSSIADHSGLKKMKNDLYLQVKAPFIGNLKGGLSYFDYNYYYNSVLFYNNNTIASKLKGNALAIGAEWDTKINSLFLQAMASSLFAGDLTGNSFKAIVGYKKDSVLEVSGFAEVASKTPNFNMLLFQSDYENYNWQNNFKNESLKILGGKIDSEKYGSVEASLQVIDNYTFFNEFEVPEQASGQLSYLKIKGNKAINFGRFTLDNTVQYQNVLDGESFFRVPEFLTKNTLYYSNYVFKGKPMYLQTGITLTYFTEFFANAYNPLLSEFTLQNTTKIGNFPLVDVFVNAQVRRTRLYFKIENVTASFTGRNYYSAPSYPYRDLTVRFGLVWNWFI